MFIRWYEPGDVLDTCSVKENSSDGDRLVNIAVKSSWVRKDDEYLFLDSSGIKFGIKSDTFIKSPINKYVYY